MTNQKLKLDLNEMGKVPKDMVLFIYFAIKSCCHVKLAGDSSFAESDHAWLSVTLCSF